MFTEMLASTVWMLEESGYGRESRILSELSERATHHAGELEEVYGEGGAGVIESVLEGLADQGSLSDERIKQIGGLWDQLQSETEKIVSVHIPTFRDHEHLWRNLEGLHHFGVITLRPAQGAVSPFVSPHFVPLMFRHLVSMDDKSCVKHIEEISRIRDRDNPLADGQPVFDKCVRPLRDSVSRATRSHIEKYLGSITASMNVAVEFLPTSSDYYGAGIRWYRSRAGFRRVYSIFSTTSGIFLPEEHYGSEFFLKLGEPDLAARMPKNRARKKYFDVLHQASFFKPRVYHFEVERAKNQFDGIVSSLDDRKRSLYEGEALRILQRFLENRNFGLVKLPKLPQPYEFLTLANTSSVLLSGRSHGKIGHGFWVKPLKANIVRDVLGELDTKDVIRDAMAATLSYFAGKGVLHALHGDLERVFYLSFVAPLAYVLLVRGRRAVRQIKGVFPDLAEQIRRDQRDCEVIKYVGREKPERRITHIEELFA